MDARFPFARKLTARHFCGILAIGGLGLLLSACAGALPPTMPVAPTTPVPRPTILDTAAPASTASVTPAPWTTYTDPASGISFQYPADWKPDEGGGNMILGTDGFVTLESLGAHQAFSLEQFCEYFAGSQSGYELLQVEGDAACLTAPQEYPPYQSVNSIIAHPLKDGRLYFVHLNASPEQIQAIAASLRWPTDGLPPVCPPDPFSTPQSATLSSGLTVETYPLDICEGNSLGGLEGFRPIPAAALEKHGAMRPTLGVWDKNGDREIKVGQDILTAHMLTDGSYSVQVQRNGTPVYQAQVTPNPVGVILNLGAYDSHWVLETAGSIVEDGVALNQQYGYEESFGWQLLAGKPFYFFRKDGKVSFSYDGQAQPMQFDSVTHYVCCSAGVLRPLGNDSMITFFAQKDNVETYVEVGKYP